MHSPSACWPSSFTLKKKKKREGAVRVDQWFTNSLERPCIPSPQSNESRHPPTGEPGTEEANGYIESMGQLTLSATRKKEVLLWIKTHSEDRTTKSVCLVQSRFEQTDNYRHLHDGGEGPLSELGSPEGSHRRGPRVQGDYKGAPGNDAWGRRGGRSGQREKLSCNASPVATSGDPMRSPGAMVAPAGPRRPDLNT